MKSNQNIVSCPEGIEKEVENKNTKWENSRDSYGYIALNIWKNSF